MVIFHILVTLRDATFDETFADHIVTIVVQNNLECLHSQ